MQCLGAGVGSTIIWSITSRVYVPLQTIWVSLSSSESSISTVRANMLYVLTVDYTHNLC